MNSSLTTENFFDNISGRKGSFDFLISIRFRRIIMIIAQYGNFALATKVYPESHEYFVRDIEIVKIMGDEGPVSIAYFNKEGALVSCGRRLLDNMETPEDIDCVKKISEIAALIYDGVNVKSGLAV